MDTGSAPPSPPPVAVRVPTELYSATAHVKSPYETLGVDKGASQEQVLDAAVGKFFGLLGVELWSPAGGDDKEATPTPPTTATAAKLNYTDFDAGKREVYTAFSVLYDNEQRAVYDSYNWTPFDKLGVFNDDGLFNYRLIHSLPFINSPLLALSLGAVVCIMSVSSLAGYFAGNPYVGFYAGFGSSFNYCCGMYIFWIFKAVADMVGAAWKLATHTAATDNNSTTQQQRLVRACGR
ncbi:hypothetical protein GQ42DRAFT_7278 [Ramicandelaber brevisporus]|nr:hypothetical protein GQ42DRAFT_7278 [Ramicandelaber brevisporus]